MSILFYVLQKRFIKNSAIFRIPWICAICLLSEIQELHPIDEPQQTDDYDVAKNQAGSWGNSIYMGDEINAGGANNPYVSPDGKYLFFNSGRNRNYDIWWVDAKIIEELRLKEFVK